MTEKNQIENNQSPRILFSLVALIFFAPIVNVLLKWNEEDYELTENDIKIIATYKKACYAIYFIILIILTLLFFYIKYSIDLLIYAIYTLVILVSAYIIYNIKLIYDNKWALFFSNDEIKKLEVKYIKAWNVDYLLLYIPFLNEYLFQKKQYSKEQEYWLKESIFFSYILWFVWVLSFFLPSFINLFYIIVLLIIWRSISLLFGIDFIPDNIKEKIYNSFSTKTVELFAYICAIFYFTFWNLINLLSNKKRLDFGFYLHQSKKYLNIWYEINSILKKFKKYLYLILSYAVFVWINLFLLIKSKNSFSYVYVLSLFIIIFPFYLSIVKEKKLYNLPFISKLLEKVMKKF